MRTESSWYSPQLSPIQSKIKVGVQKRLVSKHVLHLLFFQRSEDIQQQEWQLWLPIDTVKLMWLALWVRSVADDKVVIIDAKKYPIVTVIFYCVFNTVPIEVDLAIGRIALSEVLPV